METTKPSGFFESGRARGALYGLAIGDALAMPVHWYYNREAMRRDYGRVTDFLEPRNPHPDSILWRSSYEPLNAEGDILHEQSRYWGQRGVHYHQFLRAGENTLTVQLAMRVRDSLVAQGEYQSADYLERYVRFMRTPGSHRDTYVEECHRGFFTNLARGRDPHRCGIPEKHIGGLVGIIPVLAWYGRETGTGREAALRHLRLTHPGKMMESAAVLLSQIMGRLWGGEGLAEVIDDLHARQVSPFLQFPLGAWLGDEDSSVIGRRLSTACYVDQSLPAVLYLARKYAGRPEAGLIANTNLGGDNVHRGAVLGGLLGAAHGMKAWPERWVSGLTDPPLPQVAPGATGPERT